ASDLPALPPSVVRMTRRATRTPPKSCGSGASGETRRAVVAPVAEPTSAQGDVRLHQLSDVTLGEQLIPAQGVFDACGGKGLARGDAREIPGAIGLVTNLAEAARELGCRPERWPSVTLDQAGD